MKTTQKLLRVVTAVSGTASAIALLHPEALAAVFPNAAPVLLGVTAGVLGVKELAVIAGDWLDNGKRDNSFKP